MSFLRRKPKPSTRFAGPAPTHSDRVAALIADMDPDRVYQIIDDDGRPMLNGLLLKGRDWKKLSTPQL